MTPFYAQASGCGHRAHLLGTLTPCPPEWIDGLTNHCHDERQASYPARVGAGRAIPEGIFDCGYGGSGNKTEFLGRARVHTDGGPCDMAIRRQYALPGAGGAGRHAIHPGLWDGTAHAGQSEEHTSEL